MVKKKTLQKYIHKMSVPNHNVVEIMKYRSLCQDAVPSADGEISQNQDSNHNHMITI